MKHPNVEFTTDGKEKAYEHGGSKKSVATLSLELRNLSNSEIDEVKSNIDDKKTDKNIILLSEEEIEDYLNEITDVNEN